ncbi:MAG: alginate export family protein [Alphaproteobacteria bacterium]
MGGLAFLALALAFILGPASPAQAADVGQELQEAALGGKFNLHLRYRFEFVDQDGIDRDAKASTVRTRLGYRTGSFRDFSLFAEIEDLRAVGDDRYNSTVNGRTDFPVVVDPEEFVELNQAYIQYKGTSESMVPDTMLRVGRQQVIYDNHRWIGDVNFRQNMQTNDAVRLSNGSLPDTTLDYVYITKVHRIFGNESNAGNHAMDSHLFRGEYKGFDLGTLIGYAWVLDYERSGQFGLSSATFGARFKGAYPVREDLKALYTAEYARQVDNADNPSDFGHNYFLGELGATYAGVTGKVGYEFLDGDDTTALQTPLATGHAFQGWADKFLTTPASGIEDLYVLVKTKVKGVTLIAVYHDFNAEEGSADLGHEWDAKAVTTLYDHLELELKYANYLSDGFATDTQKIWVAVTLKY